MTAITDWIELLSSPTPEIDTAFKNYESYKVKILNPSSAYEKAIAVIYPLVAKNLAVQGEDVSGSISNFS